MFSTSIYYSKLLKMNLLLLFRKLYLTAAAAAAKSLQSCLTVRPHRRQPTRLCRPWDSPGENTGVGCHFFIQCMKVKSESEVAQLCPTLPPHGLQLIRLLHPWDFPGKSTGVGCHCLLQFFLLGITKNLCCCSVSRSCLTYCVPIDCAYQAPLSSSVSGVCSNSCSMSWLFVSGGQGIGISLQHQSFE